LAWDHVEGCRSKQRRQISRMRLDLQACPAKRSTTIHGLETRDTAHPQNPRKHTRSLTSNPKEWTHHVVNAGIRRDEHDAAALQLTGHLDSRSRPYTPPEKNNPLRIPLEGIHSKVVRRFYVVVYRYFVRAARSHAVARIFRHQDVHLFAEQE
jgi:hypothetical protein